MVQEIIRFQAKDEEKVRGETSNPSEERKSIELQNFDIEQKKLQEEFESYSKAAEYAKKDLEELKKVLARLNKEKRRKQDKFNQLNQKKEGIRAELVRIQNIRQEVQNKIKAINGGMAPLANIIRVGDYVNYPAPYENVKCFGNCKSIFSGWRVLDVTDGVVKLISGGIPLSIRKPKANFKANRIEDFEQVGFTNVGSQSILDNFSNEYTAEVSNLTEYDISKILNRDFQLPKNDNLLTIGASYYFYTAIGSHRIITDCGRVSYRINDHIRGIRPVVTLKKEVMTNGQDENGVWQILMP